MPKKIGKIAFFLALTTFFAVSLAFAGWFDSAVESAKERVGTRAVDEAADGSYNAAKDAVLNKEKGGAQGKSRPSNGSSFREPERHQPSSGLAGDAIDDDHFIQKDDYFVSPVALEKNPYIYLSLAKMVTEPSVRSKGEAEFFKVIDGSTIWTKFYFQSRIAQDGDIRLGTLVIVHEGRTDESVYLAPETKEGARGGSWFMAKVTDVSDLYRGHITVSGNYKISLRNLRILLPKLPQTSR
jgi:hypothetical protein